MKSPIEEAAEKAYPTGPGGIIDTLARREAYIQGAKDWGLKWIPVTESLPLNKGSKYRIKTVLAFNGDAPLYNQHHFIVTFFQQTMGFGKAEHAYSGTITHWMPLPEPPQGQP